MIKWIPAAFLTLFTSLAMAQLPNGSTAPNWTMTDINGNSHTLYDYLNDGKVVFLDFSATWCGPCWSYHNAGHLETLYDEHGPDGTDEVMVIFIETDVATNTDCLYGLSTCVGGTQGDWVTGTPFPIIDDHSQFGPYNINFYPTIYGICPDKKITHLGQANYNALHQFAQNCVLALPTVVYTVTPVDCHGNHTGAINLTVSGGAPPYTFNWSNGAQTEDLVDIPAGTYSVTVTGANGGNVVKGPITVSQPAAPLSNQLLFAFAAGCNGIGGQAQVQANGGTPSYTYAWSNGFSGPHAQNLPAGTYTVTTTDNNGCTHILPNIVIAPPVIPNAVVAPPPLLDCDHEQVVLDGTGSSTGQNLMYNWTTTDGNILSGNGTMNILVDEPGTYTLTVTNAVSTCSDSDAGTVVEDVAAPSANAGPAMEINCENTEVELDGSAAGGPNLDYLWTTVGGNIVSGATTLHPIVDEEGSYTLTVTNADNGCTAASTTSTTENITEPDAAAEGGELTCTVSEVTLEGSSTTPDVEFLWAGPNGFSSDEQNPTVSIAGAYTLTVTDPANSCSASAEAEVSQTTTPPQASATGGTITCADTEITLQGSSTTPGVSFAWAGPNNFSNNQPDPTVDVPGSYVLTVTAPNGCSKTANATVNENTTLPTASAGPDGVLNCFASSLVLNGTGSSSGSQFSYAWFTFDGNIVSGGTTRTPTVDAAGSYTISVFNANNGCLSTASTTVTQTPELIAEISSQTPLSCHGQSNGSATVTASGGDGDFTYAWSNGQDLPTATDLSAGSYTVTVTDGEECSASQTVTLADPAQLLLTASATAQSAPGVDDGTASANASGGTGSLNFSWSNGETTAVISGLAPGNYSVTATDANGCAKTKTVTVNEFGCAVSADIFYENVNCHGGSDGSASLSLANAADPIEYLWSNGGETASIENLPAGDYAVTASDANGCEVAASVTIEQPAPLQANTTATEVTAQGANDGTATSNPTGGTGPFSFEWNNGGTGPMITNLPSANYTVSVTDANGCTAVRTVPVAPFSCAMQANLSASDVSCHGQQDGQATVTLGNGLSPFSYDWSNGENTATAHGLGPGSYSVSVSDAVGCATTAEIEIAEPAALTAGILDLENADCNVSNGSASVAATGGTGVLSFAWSQGVFGASQTGLEAGSYTVVVTDANSCSVSVAVEIGVNDAEAPTVFTQNITLNLGVSGTANLAPQQVNAGSTDNCGIASMTLSQTTFTCADLGPQTVMLTVTDAAGNSASAPATVTVQDLLAPAIIVQDVVLALDANGQATLLPELLDAGSTDNCGIASRSADLTNFTCADLGANAVVLTVTDASGLSASGTAIVTVVDNLPPVVDCPADLVLPYCQPIGTFSAPAVDNCSANVQRAWSHPSGSNFPAGETPVTVTVSDGQGNATTCQFTVTVQPDLEINPTVWEISCHGGSDGGITTEVAGGSPGYQFDWSNGETDSEITGLATGVYALTVTDADGCAETTSFTLSEPTAIAVVDFEITPSVNSQPNGGVEVTVAGGNPGYGFVWKNAAGQTVSQEEDLSGVPAGLYTLTVTDANGCTDEFDFVVTLSTATSDRELTERVHLFPNPTSGWVTLQVDGLPFGEASIQIFDVQGRLVLDLPQAKFTAGQIRLDFSQQPAGVYVMKLRLENHVVAKRIVVSK